MRFDREDAGFLVIAISLLSFLFLFPPTDGIMSATQLWRIRTLDGRNREKLLVNYCNATRNGVSIGEPNYYRNGYVEFVTDFVAEGDLIGIYVQKDGYFPINTTFVVPRIPYLQVGQTYYVLAEVLLYPLPELVRHPEKEETTE